jgi:hypothetical protein
LVSSLCITNIVCYGWTSRYICELDWYVQSTISIFCLFWTINSLNIFIFHQIYSIKSNRQIKKHQQLKKKIQ